MEKNQTDPKSPLEIKEKLVDDILDLLFDEYVCGEEQVLGQAISFLRTSLRNDGWKHLGNLSDFASLVEELGFAIKDGKNTRGNRARVVTL